MSEDDKSNVIDELEKLARLKASGTISDDEFEKLKQGLLDRLSVGTFSSNVQPASSLQSMASGWPSGEKRSLRFYTPIAIIAFILVGIFVLPLLMEGTGSECSALERGVLRIAEKTSPDPSNGLGTVFATFLQRMSNGTFAQAMAAKKYPNLPPALACTVAYYDVRFTSDGASTPSSGTNNSEPSANTAPSAPSSVEQQQPTNTPSLPETTGSSPSDTATNSVNNNSNATTDDGNQSSVAPTTPGPVETESQTVAPAQPVTSNTASSQPASGQGATAVQPEGHWYYCDPAKAYYPYVQRCPVPWRPVTPAQASASPQGSSPTAATGPPTSLTPGSQQ